MRINRQKLTSACDAVIEILESRLLLSGGLLGLDQDIGSPAQPGSSTYASGVYTVVGGGVAVGGGAPIGGNSDQFNFAYENFSGNGTIVANVNSLNNTNAAAEAGIMFRNDTTASSALAGIFVTATNGVMFVARAADGGPASQSTTVGVHAPEYLELTLSGSTVTGYYSSNGVTWTQLGASQPITLGSSALVGLAVASANASMTTTAAFSNVSVLPPGWSDNDVGSPPLPGSAGYNSIANTLTVNGSGTGIGSSADQFNFTNDAMTGNATVDALVDSLTNTDPNAQAGVMIRADTTAGSLFAGVSVSPQNVATFEWRSVSGSVSSTSTAVSGPGWLELTDQGNNFSAFYSSDDVHWTQVGTTQAISMPGATVLAGLWVSSNNGAAQNTAVFSDVSLVEGGWTDNDIGSPAIGGSADYDAPSDTYTISGNGSDIWGTADQFNFAGTTMTGNGSVLTYVDSITNTNAWAKAGVMIRNDITAGSAFAAVLVSPTSGITFEWRSTAGGAANQEVSSPAGGPTPAPVGLELTRSGNNSFTAYYSTDGITWITVGPSVTVALNTTALAGLAVTSHNTGAICTATFSSTGVGSSPAPGAGIYSASDQLFLNDLENREVMFYWDEANSTTGLVPDNANASGGSPSADSSIAAIGFGLSALTIGDARGWLSHANAYQRTLTTLNFLYNSGANVNGFFYHFLNANGTRNGTSEVSSVDTAELMAGVLNVAQYWAGTPLQTVALQLYDRVNWPWMQQSNGVFYGAWTPESGFSGGYGDFSEAVVLYLLGLGSPTYPTSQTSWNSWSRSPSESYGGYNFITADDAALFTEQYPQAWFNLQGLTDSHGLNYYQNSQTATLAQRQFMINLSSTYSDYGPNMWGLTPSEGINGYTVWGGPPADGPIDGTVVPTAPGGSLEFEPRLSINALENMKQTYGRTTYLKYGFVDAFNPLKSWTSPLVLGIDVGMTLISAENSRSNLVWNTFSQSTASQQAIAKAFPSSTAREWAIATSGNWNLSSNWSPTTVPNSAGAEADFFDSTPPIQTVYSNAGITLGTLHFNSVSEWVIAGAASLTLQGSGSNGAVVEVDQGTAELDLPITLASNTTFNVATGATLIIANPITIDPGVTLTQIGGGTVTYESIINVGAGGSVAFNDSTYAEQLSLAAGATATVGGVGTVLEVSSLSNGGTLNLGSNTLVINYGSSADPIASVRSLLAGGYANGRWNGSGINSSAAAANTEYGLGYADSADPGNPAGLSSGQIEIKYAFLGDTNLDGVVNGSDFTTLVGNLGKSVTGWDQGDFLYTGAVTGSDFTALVGNLGKQSNAVAVVLPASALSMAAVTLSPSTVDPLSGVSTVLAQAGAVSSSNIVLTDQNQDQKNIVPPSAALNRDGNRNRTKFGSTHHPRA